MGQGVLDQQTGSNVFYPDNVSTDEVEKSMSDFQNGAIREAKPDWYTQFIKEPLEKMGASIYDPVMTARATLGGIAQGIQPLVPFKIAPTPTEQEAFKAVSPMANTLGQFGGMGAAVAALQTATGGLVDAAAPFLSKIPALAGLVSKMTALKEAGGVGATVAKVGEGSTIAAATLGEYGALQSVSQQKNTYGNVNWHDVTIDTLKNAGMGFVAGGVMSYIAKPLAEMGAPQELMEQIGKRMVASGAVMGGMTAAGGGSKRDVMLASGIGALYAGIDAHGEVEGIRRSTIDELTDLKARYLLSQTGGDETAVKQVAQEHTQNQAEEVIHEALQGSWINEKFIPLSKSEEPFKPSPSFIGREKDFSDPYDPKLFQFLHQFIPADRLVRMDSEERLWLGNEPFDNLVQYGRLHAEAAVEPAFQEDLLRQYMPQILGDDAKREKGIAVDRTALDEVASSKELTQNLLAKTANELTGVATGNKTGEQIGERNPRGTEDANKGGKEVRSGSTKEGVERQARTGIRLRDNDETGTAQTKTEGKVATGDKVAKSSQDIADQLVKRGVDELSDEDKAHFASTSYKGKSEELSNLMRTDPQTAERIATGETESSLSPSEKQLLFNMVKIKADEDRNFELGLKLARSPLNIERSEAAKTLGSSGFNNAFEHDPVKIIKQVEDAKAVEAKKSEPLVKKVKATVKASAPKISDWQKFIEEIKC